MIRKVIPTDIADITAIYNYYVIILFSATTILSAVFQPIK